MPTVNEIRRRMAGLGPAAPTQFAGPVQRGFQGSAQPLQSRPPVFGGGPVQDTLPIGDVAATRGDPAATRPQAAAPPRFDGGPQRISPFLTRFSDFVPGQGKQPSAGFGNTRPPEAVQPIVRGKPAFARPPLFNGNFTLPFEQMQAAKQGFQSQMPRQRPFAAFHAGQRQGRGGRQPVTSQQDAAFRQRLQESFANQNRFANTAGNIRGRTLQRRPVFA